MVTMERPTPSADGAPPPTIAWAGAETSNARPAITWSMIFISTGIARTPRIAKGRIEWRSSGDRGWPPRRRRVSRFPIGVHTAGNDAQGSDLGFWRRAHHVTLRGVRAL